MLFSQHERRETTLQLSQKLCDLLTALDLNVVFNRSIAQWGSCYLHIKDGTEKNSQLALRIADHPSDRKKRINYRNGKPYPPTHLELYYDRLGKLQVNIFNPGNVQAWIDGNSRQAIKPFVNKFFDTLESLHEKSVFTVLDELDQRIKDARQFTVEQTHIKVERQRQQDAERAIQQQASRAAKKARKQARDARKPLQHLSGPDGATPVERLVDLHQYLVDLKEPAQAAARNYGLRLKVAGRDLTQLHRHDAWKGIDLDRVTAMVSPLLTCQVYQYLLNERSILAAEVDATLAESPQTSPAELAQSQLRGLLKRIPLAQTPITVIDDPSVAYVQFKHRYFKKTVSIDIDENQARPPQVEGLLSELQTKVELQASLLKGRAQAYKACMEPAALVELQVAVATHLKNSLNQANDLISTLQVQPEHAAYWVDIHQQNTAACAALEEQLKAHRATAELGLTA